jgi:hypothetical protein
MGGALGGGWRRERRSYPLTGRCSTQQIHFLRSIAACNLEQARTLGEKLGYYVLSVEPDPDGSLPVAFGTERPRPQLRLISGST